jgi:hypothetical protein
MKRYLRTCGPSPGLKKRGHGGNRSPEQQKAARLDAAIEANLRELGYGE